MLNIFKTKILLGIFFLFAVSFMPAKAAHNDFEDFARQTMPTLQKECEQMRIDAMQASEMLEQQKELLGDEIREALEFKVAQFVEQEKQWAAFVEEHYFRSFDEQENVKDIENAEKSYLASLRAWRIEFEKQYKKIANTTKEQKEAIARAERERIEQERIEQERIERERIEQEHIEAQRRWDEEHKSGFRKCWDHFVDHPILWFIYGVIGVIICSIIGGIIFDGTGEEVGFWLCSPFIFIFLVPSALRGIWAILVWFFTG